MTASIFMALFRVDLPYSKCCLVHSRGVSKTVAVVESFKELQIQAEDKNKGKLPSENRAISRLPSEGRAFPRLSVGGCVAR